MQQYNNSIEMEHNTNNAKAKADGTQKTTGEQVRQTCGILGPLQYVACARLCLFIRMVRKPSSKTFAAVTLAARADGSWLAQVIADLDDLRRVGRIVRSGGDEASWTWYHSTNVTSLKSVGAYVRALGGLAHFFQEHGVSPGEIGALKRF